MSPPAPPRAPGPLFDADPRPDVVLPVHAGRRGHPIVLAAELFGSIANLGPDQPLRDVVRPAVGLEVQVADAGILVDLDTPDDLRRALGDS